MLKVPCSNASLFRQKLKSTGELEGNWKEIDFGLLLEKKLEREKKEVSLRMVMGLASHYDSSLR